ncbi:hypothetical protein C2E23DRAFT_233656 [Lenzites betulinus]|nr:hypothetical protein C2E23DRAFT_233656 [Lenzites betulinus]
MIVAKESKLARDSVGQYPDPHAASSSSPIVMSPPPVEQQPIPNMTAAAAPPAYTPLPAGGSSSGQAATQASPAPAGVSERHPAPERHHARSASEYSGAEHEHSAARAFARGMLVIVMFPLIAFLGALYGVGKIIEGTGKGLAAGPESAYRSYRAREAREQEERRSKRAKPEYDA